MDLLDSLIADHKLIHGTMAAFGRYLDRLEKGPEPERQDLHRFVTFIVDYAESWHHRKEEDVLFVALARHGWGQGPGPLAHIRSQHVQERQLFALLTRAAMHPKLWTPEGQTEFISVGREWLRFENEHMQKENELLYPAAARDLASEIPDQVADELTEFERLHREHGYIDWLKQLGDDLTRAYPA